MQEVLHRALENMSSEKQYQEKCLLLLIHALETGRESKSMDQTPDADRNHLLSKYQLIVSSVLMSSLPQHFPGMNYACIFTNEASFVIKLCYFC